MPRSRRCCQAGWWPGQYHRSAASRPSGRLTDRLRAAPFLILLTFAPAVFGQNLLSIRVLEGEGAIHAAGSKASRPIVVEITDETGRPLEGVAVSFRMPEEGPGASFPQSMKTDIRITAPDGKAMAHDFVTNRTSGPFQVRVTAVKGPIRAGVIVGQYISDGPVKSPEVRQGKSHKWKFVVAVAAAAAAGAVVAATGGGGAAGSAGSQTPAGPPPAAPTIGAPTISVGGPQ